jgi:hypothetical protein
VKGYFEVKDDTLGVWGEGVWTKPLGNQLLRDPERARGALAESSLRWSPKRRAQWPKLLEVVRRSGHRTLHLYFLKKSSRIEKDEVLKKLGSGKHRYENSDGKLYAVDVEPDRDFDGLCEYLDQWGKGDKVDFRKGWRLRP